MDRRSRVIVFLIIAVVLVAAIFAVIPGNSPFKLPSILVVSIIGTLSALAQFIGVDVFRRLFAQSRIISQEDLLKYFIEHRLLVHSAALGRQPIYQLDIGYWTNLTLDFSRIVQEPATLAMCVDCVRSLLPPSSRPVLFIEPLDLGQSQSDIRLILEEVVKRVPGRFIRAKEVHKYKKATVFAGIFSSQIRQFLLQEAGYVDTAVFLIGPDSHYISKTYGNLPLRLISIISTDTLQKLDLGTRRSIIYPS